ncbi:hypothetical protein DPMN_138746 [Dreissena polymorpha]|uniref:Uncharacterized protein n=1 Tax=Dreissena polymorpha TaxID=45954 RepID=A0A9D4G4E8_DREPO|nr:hypothetical protein DPMN_138746 [Dreissena polymorpha]
MADRISGLRRLGLEERPKLLKVYPEQFRQKNPRSKSTSLRITSSGFPSPSLCLSRTFLRLRT